MKKIFNVIFMLTLLLNLSACTDKALDEYEVPIETSIETKEALTVDSFCKKVKGLWGHENDSGQWDILQFENGKINDYNYAGHVWISDGIIDNVDEISADSVRINISYNEVVYDGDSTSKEVKKHEFIFKSNDEFVSNLMVGDWEYIYLCENKNELDAVIDELSYSRVSKSDINFVLDRKIFAFKNDYPHIYNKVVKDIYTLNPYVGNWDFRKILNDTYYTNIEWSVEKATDKSKFLTFSGENEYLPYENNMVVKFYIQEGAINPLIWSMKTITNEETTDIGVEEFVNEGIDEATALMYADASISLMLATINPNSIN